MEIRGNANPMMTERSSEELVDLILVWMEQVSSSAPGRE
jgi:hypothetical protein